MLARLSQVVRKRCYILLQNKKKYSVVHFIHYFMKLNKVILGAFLFYKLNKMKYFNSVCFCEYNTRIKYGIHRPI